MSMATATLIRTEANIPTTVVDAKFTSPISNAEDEIRRIVRHLEALVIDYNYLEDDDNTFSEDNGNTFRLTYDNIKELSDGYDSVDDVGYVALIAAIDTAIQANGHDALTDDDKYQLRQAGRDFRKAEILLSLSYFSLIGNLRPANEGGFIKEVSFGSGKSNLLSPPEAKTVSNQFRREAYKQLFPWLKDPKSDIITDSIEYSDGSREEYFLPDSFSHPDINISAAPTPLKRKDIDPRKRYGNAQ